MLTLKKLITATPHQIVVRSLAQCRTTVTRAILEEDEFGNKRKNVAGLVRATDGDRFCVIMFYDPDKKNLVESKVWVSCSCPFFCFYNETVLALHKSSDVINSNGDLPLIRNPRMIPYVCKHLVALAKKALKVKFKDVVPPKKVDTKKEKGQKVPPAKALEKKGLPKKQYTKKPVKPLAKPK